MGVLATATSNHLDLKEPVPVIVFNYSGRSPLLVLVRLVVSNITGNGLYMATAYIGDNPLVPEHFISIQNCNSYVTQTKEIVIISGDTLSVQLQGQPGDTDASCIAHIVNTRIADADIAIIGGLIADSRTRTILSPLQPALTPVPHVLRSPLVPIPHVLK